MRASRIIDGNRDFRLVLLIRSSYGVPRPQPPPCLQPFDIRSFPSRSTTSSSMSVWDEEGLRERVGQWVYEFRVVLGRAATQYTRNLGNVIARLMLMALLGFMQVRPSLASASHFYSNVSLSLNRLCGCRRAWCTWVQAWQRGPTHLRP